MSAVPGSQYIMVRKRHDEAKIRYSAFDSQGGHMGNKFNSQLYAFAVVNLNQCHGQLFENGRQIKIINKYHGTDVESEPSMLS